MLAKYERIGFAFKGRVPPSVNGQGRFAQGQGEEGEGVTHFSFSALNCWVQSSNSFWFISMNSFSALYIKPWIVL